MADDESFLQSFAEKLFGSEEQSLQVLSAFRLEKKNEYPTLQPRPLKIVIDSPGDCARVLKRTYRLQNESYRVLRDLAPEDRVRMKAATDELKTRKLAGETNLIIRDFHVIAEQPRIRWRSITLHSTEVRA